MHRIPIWVEMVTYIEQINPDEPLVGLDDRVAELLPEGCEIITACTVDEVDHVMSAQTGEMLETLAAVRQQLRVLAGAIERDIATPQTAAMSVRNVIAMIPDFPERHVPTAPER